MTYKYEESMETSLEIDLEEELEYLEKFIKETKEEIYLLQTSIDIDLYPGDSNMLEEELEITKVELKELEREYEELLEYMT